HGEGVFQFFERGARSGFPLADLTTQLPQPRLLRRTILRLDFARLALQMTELLNGPLNLLRKLLPFGRPKRNFAYGKRSLDLGAIQPRTQPLPRLLVRYRSRFYFLRQLLHLPIQHNDVGEHLLQIGPPLQVGRSAFFQVSEIEQTIELDPPFLDLLRKIHYHTLDHRGSAQGLLHPELTALHSPGQIDFAFPRQQRTRAHLAQIHSYRGVSVDGLFHRLRV